MRAATTDNAVNNSSADGEAAIADVDADALVFDACAECWLHFLICECANAEQYKCAE